MVKSFLVAVIFVVPVVDIKELLLYGCVTF